VDAELRSELVGYFRKARAKLASAEVLAGAGQADDAISRAYYAVFHASSALLLMDGIRSRSHSGLGNQLGLRFIAPGRLDRRWSRVLADLRGERENGDYGLGSFFDASHVREAIALAREFLDIALSVVRKETGDNLAELDEAPLLAGIPGGERSGGRD
jgi:uncharacterized protein (UPF0332 family)